MYDILKVRMVCKWLIFNDYADNDSELAKLIGYTKSSFSQIMNEKVPISSKFIDKLCGLDKNINKVWILRNEGEMLKGSIVPKPIIPEDVGKIAMLEGIIRDKDDIIDGLKFKVATLEKEIRANEHDVPYILDKKNKVGA
jgi:transcriptional regulator with XRE-family HTH domain